MTEPNPPSALGLPGLGLTAATALLGSGAAAWHWAVPLTERLPWVAGTAVLGTVVARGLTARPGARARGRPAEPPAPRAPEPAARWSRAATSDAATSDAATSDAATGRPAAPAARDAVTPAHGESGEALIAQCPRCGDFRLDVHRDVRSYSLRCAGGCGHCWTWAPGSPWPPVVVRRSADSRGSVQPERVQPERVQMEHRKADT